jgi:hypothetical protein
MEGGNSHTMKLKDTSLEANKNKPLTLKSIYNTKIYCLISVKLMYSLHLTQTVGTSILNMTTQNLNSVP